tara:strand:+ start:3282 stop:3950 length:669 start_codon:yes stop_codon:yes gene_type:complete
MPCYQKGEQIPNGLVTREYATTPVSYSSKLTCEENCAIPCGTPAVAGGVGVTKDLYYFGPEAMDLPFYYEAFSVPDRFTVTAFETGAVLFDINAGLMVGEPANTVLIRKPYGPSVVMVTVTGPEGTLWRYRIDCANEGKCCIPNPSDETKPDCTIVPRAECLRLGGQYCGECSEVELALSPAGCSNRVDDCEDNPVDSSRGCCANWSNPYCCGGEPGDNPLP